MRYKCVLAFAIFLLGTRIAVSAASPCSQNAITAAASQVDLARKALLALPIEDGMQTNVSLEAQKRIIAMKAHLDDLFVAYLACAGPNAEPKKIELELSSIAHAFSLEGRSYTVDELPKEANNYGYQLEFHVRQQAGSAVLGIAASFQIECGMDSILGVFVRDNESWKQVIRWTSKPYKTISRAFWAFDYAISPPDHNGNWFVATKFINPWCSSTWSGIHYSVLRPSVGALQPKVLFSGSDFMWWGNEDFGSLSVEADKFDLRFHSSSIDGGVHNRVFVRKFTVTGGKVQRIPPVAVSPRDFVDEWIVSRWKDASRWSQPAQSTKLEEAHRHLRKNQIDGFDSVHKCEDSPNHFQVALSISDRLEYFQVVGDSPNFTMTEVSNSPQPQCGGPNVLESMATQ